MTHVTEAGGHGDEDRLSEAPTSYPDYCPHRGEGPWPVDCPYCLQEYGRLVRIGCCYGPEFHPDAEEMLLRLAEPWFDAIRRRAARDGLRIHCFAGYDSYTSARGASAELMRPDGSLYPLGKRLECEAMMLADWGETLRLARLASPA